MNMISAVKSKIANVYHWHKKSSAYETFISRSLDSFGDSKHVEVEKKGVVIVQPWMLTAVPYYSITVALLLRSRGHNTDILIDDLHFGKSSFLFNIQLNRIKKICSSLPADVKVLFLSNYKTDAPTAISNDAIKDLANQNTIHHMRGELKKEGRIAYYDAVLQQLNQAAPYISAFMKSYEYNYIHIAGGIFGTSGLYINMARSLGIRINTFDSGKDVLLTSTRGVAAQLTDIPVSFKLLQEVPDPEVKKRMTAEAVEQINLRMHGKDAFKSQVSSPEMVNAEKDVDEVGCLILLNSPWDSAALGIHKFYSGYSEWLLNTVSHILENTKHTVTVRQHPAERFKLVASNDDYKAELESRHGQHPRLKFISCDSSVNTYELMKRSKVIVCFSSTSGVEAAIIGKPVIVASRCYYSELGFVFSEPSKEKYLARISEMLDAQSFSGEVNKDGALTCYFLGQCCNWLFTKFTPYEGNFYDWSGFSLSELLKITEVEEYLRSIESGKPLSFIVASRKLNIQ